METDYDYTPDIPRIDSQGFDYPSIRIEGYGTGLEDIIHHAMPADSDFTTTDTHIGVESYSATSHSEISFGAKYSDAEIQKMESDVDMAEHEMKCRENDMNNWRSKVSLNDTKEHRANGDYDNAANHYNEARVKYNSAVDKYNSALSKLNNAR